MPDGKQMLPLSRGYDCAPELSCCRYMGGVFSIPALGKDDNNNRKADFEIDWTAWKRSHREALDERCESSRKRMSGG